MAVKVKALWDLKKITHEEPFKKGNHTVGNYETYQDRNKEYNGWFEAKELPKVDVHDLVFNSFRSKLAKLVYGISDLDVVLNNPTNFESLPFYRLIDIAHKYASYDTKTSKELLEDFYRFESKARAILEPEYFELYMNLEEAFKTAVQQNGIVTFE